MIKNFIPQQEIKRHHPKGMASHTDGEYTQLASDLLQRIDACHVKDLTAQERRDIAVNLALYYEDILADASVMSIRGEEHGRKIFQENYDFLVRAIMRDKYVEG